MVIADQAGSTLYHARLFIGIFLKQFSSELCGTFEEYSAIMVLAPHSPHHFAHSDICVHFIVSTLRLHHHLVGHVGHWWGVSPTRR